MKQSLYIIISLFIAINSFGQDIVRYHNVINFIKNDTSIHDILYASQHYFEFASDTLCFRISEEIIMNYPTPPIINKGLIELSDTTYNVKNIIHFKESSGINEVKVSFRKIKGKHYCFSKNGVFGGPVYYFVFKLNNMNEVLSYSHYLVHTTFGQTPDYYKCICY